MEYNNISGQSDLNRNGIPPSQRAMFKFLHYMQAETLRLKITYYDRFNELQ